MIPLRDSQPSQSVPVLTIILITLNVFIFLYQWSLDPFSRNHFVATYGMVPASLALPTLVTSMFLHGGWLHLIGNMWFLWIFGDNVEDVLGRGRFLAFYLLSGLAAAFVHLFFNLDSRIPTVGASGAIAGVMGAYLRKFPHSRIVTLVPIFIFFTTFEIPAGVMLAYWFFIQFVSGIGDMAMADASQGGVAWFAHVGGFIAGWILIGVFRTYQRYRWHPEFHW